jgi:two-component system, response regulator, stage 0 sporulation protein F
MKHRILFVDDEEINLFIMTKRFEGKYDVSTVSSPFDGLKLLEKESDEFKVVVTDLRMPDMDGLEFVARAKELYPNIHFFLLTGYEYNEEIDDAVKSKRVTRLFGKPFDFDEMNLAISECLV